MNCRDNNLRGIALAGPRRIENRMTRLLYHYRSFQIISTKFMSISQCGSGISNFSAHTYTMVCYCYHIPLFVPEVNRVTGRFQNHELPLKKLIRLGASSALHIISTMFTFLHLPKATTKLSQLTRQKQRSRPSLLHSFVSTTNVICHGVVFFKALDTIRKQIGSGTCPVPCWKEHLGHHNSSSVTRTSR